MITREKLKLLLEKEKDEIDMETELKLKLIEEKYKNCTYDIEVYEEKNKVYKENRKREILLEDIELTMYAPQIILFLNRFKREIDHYVKIDKNLIYAEDYGMSSSRFLVKFVKIFNESESIKIEKNKIIKKYYNN